MVKTSGETQCIYLIVIAHIKYQGWKPQLEEMPKGEEYIYFKYLYMPGVHCRHEILLWECKGKFYIMYSNPVTLKNCDPLRDLWLQNRETMQTRPCLKTTECHVM